jgi:hypothetical protein
MPPPRSANDIAIDYRDRINKILESDSNGQNKSEAIAEQLETLQKGEENYGYPALFGGTPPIIAAAVQKQEAESVYLLLARCGFSDLNRYQELIQKATKYADTNNPVEQQIPTSATNATTVTPFLTPSRINTIINNKCSELEKSNNFLIETRKNKVEYLSEGLANPKLVSKNLNFMALFLMLITVPTAFEASKLATVGGLDRFIPLTTTYFISTSAIASGVCAGFCALIGTIASGKLIHKSIAAQGHDLVQQSNATNSAVEFPLFSEELEENPREVSKEELNKTYINFNKLIKINYELKGKLHLETDNLKNHLENPLHPALTLRAFATMAFTTVASIMANGLVREAGLYKLYQLGTHLVSTPTIAGGIVGAVFAGIGTAVTGYFAYREIVQKQGGIIVDGETRTNARDYAASLKR